MGAVLIIWLFVMFGPPLLLTFLICVFALSGHPRRFGRVAYLVACPIFALIAVVVFEDWNKPGPVTHGLKGYLSSELVVLMPAASIGCLLGALIFRSANRPS
jgi:hypothetical protein